MIAIFSRGALAALLLTATSIAAAADDFKLGAINPLTGPGAEIGRRTNEGLKAAVELANTRGGIAGMHINMIACDTQSVEQQAVLCARKLLSEDKVNLLAGAGTTPQSMAILPTVEQAGVPMFSIAGGTVVFRPLKKWVFKSLAGNDDQIPSAVDYLKSKGVKTIAVIRDNGPFGNDVAANLKPAAAKAGLEIVADELYAPTDTDMTPQITRIRALHPDAIFDMSSNPPPGAIVAKKIAQLGITVPIVVGTNLQTRDFATLSGDAAEQELFIGEKAALPKLPPNDPLADNINAFRTEFAAVNPTSELVSLSTSAADIPLLAQAAAKPLGAKALDGDALRQGLESIHGMPGIQGIWSFSATSHETSLRDGIVMLRFQKGNWVAAQ